MAVWFQNSHSIFISLTLDSSATFSPTFENNSLKSKEFDCTFSQPVKIPGAVSETPIPFSSNKAVLIELQKQTPGMWTTLGTGNATQEKILCKMKATFEYAADEAGELALEIDDEIYITFEDPSGWFTGFNKGVKGMFPSNFATKVDDTAPATSTIATSSTSSAQKKICKAMYDYEKIEENEIGFKIGDIITVTSEDPSGWWTGELNGESGLFPSIFVEVISQPSSATVSTSAAIGNAAVQKRNQLNKVQQPQQQPPKQSPSTKPPQSAGRGQTQPSKPSNSAPMRTIRPNVPQSDTQTSVASSASIASISSSPTVANPHNWPTSLPDYEKFCQQITSTFSSARAEGQPSPAVITPTSSPSIAFVSLDGKVFLSGSDSFAPLMEATIIPLFSLLWDQNSGDVSNKVSFPSGTVEQFVGFCSLMNAKGSKSVEEKLDECGDRLCALCSLPSGICPAQYSKAKSDDDFLGRIAVMGVKGQLSESSSPSAVSKFFASLSSFAGSVKQCAILAATLANEGVNPCTNEKILTPVIVQSILTNVFTSLKSCKAPILTTRSGFALLPLQKIGGIAMYSPQLSPPSGPNFTKEFPPYSNTSSQAMSAAEEIAKKFKL